MGVDKKVVEIGNQLELIPAQKTQTSPTQIEVVPRTGARGHETGRVTWRKATPGHTEVSKLIGSGSFVANSASKYD